MTHKLGQQTHTPCTLRTFWLGLSDWWYEQTHPEMTGAAQSSRPQGPPVWALALVIITGVFVASVVVAALAPVVAGGLSLAGTKAVSVAVTGLATATFLFLVIGIPVKAGLGAFNFMKQMCLRGREIESGVRVPCRYR